VETADPLAGVLSYEVLVEGVCRSTGRAMWKSKVGQRSYFATFGGSLGAAGAR
jgi:hypothetical protein